jgi:putative oxidoreductase
MNMTKRLEGKVAIVTGASQGIGLAIVEALADEGAQVIGAARSVSAELRAVSPEALAVDLATPEGPGELVAHAIGRGGGVDVLVNNVGAFHARTEGFANVEDADWQASLELNLLSPVRTIRAALPSLLERHGAIINVSSINARVPQPPVVDYAAAKAALTAVGTALAEELGPQGVRVNTVSPGPTRTPAWESPDGFGASLARASGTSLDAFLDDFPTNAGLSTGRLTEPDEVAAIVALLASGRLRNANGSDFTIDGGQNKAAV